MDGRVPEREEEDKQRQQSSAQRRVTDQLMPVTIQRPERLFPTRGAFSFRVIVGNKGGKVRSPDGAAIIS